MITSTSSRPSRSQKLAGAGLLALMIGASLSGCALDFVPGTASAERDTAQPQIQDEPTDEGVADETADAPAGDESDAGTDTGTNPDADSIPSRAEAEAVVQSMVSCPGGSVEIADISSVLELDSDCDEVAVTGSGVILLANDVESLSVTGIDVIVYAKQLGSVDVSGSGSIVTWESGTPAVSNTGINNILLPAE